MSQPISGPEHARSAMAAGERNADLGCAADDQQVERELLADPCRWVRRVCQSADYGDASASPLSPQESAAVSTTS